MQMYLHLVEVLENNYPEMVKQMFIINGMSDFYMNFDISTIIRWTNVGILF